MRPSISVLKANFRTPLHVDVFTSFSWSVNVCGKKRWIFLIPGEENKLKDKYGNLCYDVTDSLNSINYLEVIQQAGEAIFVPSNWYHQVWNLEDTISVNHNWINGCNIDTMWYSLSNHLNYVENEIQDCKEMKNFEDHSQLVLKTSFGMDFTDFYKFIDYIAKKRILQFSYNEKEIEFTEKRKLGRNHVLFDLFSLRNVIKLMLEHKDVKRLHYFRDLLKLTNEIENMIS